MENQSGAYLQKYQPNLLFSGIWQNFVTWAIGRWNNIIKKINITGNKCNCWAWDGVRLEIVYLVETKNFLLKVLLKKINKKLKANWIVQ